MLLSPSSSPPRVILEDRINVESTPPRRRKSQLPTPPKEAGSARKRPARQHAQEKSRKKARTCIPVEEHLAEDSEEEDPELFEEESENEGPRTLARARRRTAFHAQSASRSVLAHTFRGLEISTRPTLQSFISCLKSDVYTCQSLNTNTFLTPPHACAYSHGAKSGGKPLLAVATEEGAVHIINTSRRQPWDPEPPRKVFRPHENSIFDIKWDRTDTQVLTSSGDHTSRLIDVESTRPIVILHGHSSTVKTACWDPTNDSLLATGGRDGAICLWDKRISTTIVEGTPVTQPVIVIPDAHEDPTKPKVRKSKKHVPMPKTVTGLIYPDSQSFGLASCGAFDGILRFWDLRTPKKTRASKPKPPPCLYSTPIDPTTLNGSRRPRGIISLAQGTGPTAGLVFGMGQDSRVHTYALPTLAAQPTEFFDDAMQAGSFYVGLSLSPCGKWLACGASNPKSSSFLFEVKGAGGLGGSVQMQRGVELQGQKGEVGAVDWADGSLATCSDDGTVRVWRPDIEIYRQCEADPDRAQWDWCWSRQVA